MNKSKIIKYFFLLALPVLTFAQTPINIKIPNPAGKNTDIMKIINALLDNVVLPIGAVVAVFFVIYSGFTYVTAQGKPAEIQKANQRLLWTLVGVGILLGAKAISLAVQATISAIIGS